MPKSETLQEKSSAIKTLRAARSRWTNPRLERYTIPLQMSWHIANRTLSLSAPTMRRRNPSRSPLPQNETTIILGIPRVTTPSSETTLRW